MSEKENIPETFHPPKMLEQLWVMRPDIRAANENFEICFTLETAKAFDVRATFRNPCYPWAMKLCSSGLSDGQLQCIQSFGLAKTVEAYPDLKKAVNNILADAYTEKRQESKQLTRRRFLARSGVVAAGATAGGILGWSKSQKDSVGAIAKDAAAAGFGTGIVVAAHAGWTHHGRMGDPTAFTRPSINRELFAERVNDEMEYMMSRVIASEKKGRA